MGEFAILVLTQEYTHFVQGKLPLKLKDPWCFTIPCNIGETYYGIYLCYLRAKINIMPLFIFKNPGIGVVRPTTIILMLNDRSICYPQGMIANVLIRVDKFEFFVNFIIMDFSVEEDILIMFRRSFLPTRRTLIDMEKENSSWESMGNK